MSTPNFPINQPNNKLKGLYLKYEDFKKLERIIEDYNLDDNNQIDFNHMMSEEKEILWKIKTIIRNMESVRLRVLKSKDTEYDELHDLAIKEGNKE